MDSILRTNPIEKDYAFEGKCHLCRIELKKFFDAICEESPEIMDDWLKYEYAFSFESQELPFESEELPLEVYEVEIVPNVGFLLDYFDIWDFSLDDNQFLIQAMVNKIAIPMWLIFSICNRTAKTCDLTLNPYCKIMVNFKLSGKNFQLKMFTLKNKKTRPINWCELFQVIMETSISLPEKDNGKQTIFDKNLTDLTEMDVERVHDIFVKLMRISDNRSKVARVFWMHLDSVLPYHSGDKLHLCILPPIEY